MLDRQPVSCPYELYVDGSPGPKKEAGWSGWGLALMAGDSLVYEACGVTHTRVTSNAIELEAVIQGLAYLLRIDMPAVVPLWTDSQYAAVMMSQLTKLNRCKFEKGNGKKIANWDRIAMLHDLYHVMGSHERCIIRKVRGHDGVAGNEHADRLSKLAAYKGEIWYRDHRAFITENETNESD